MKTNFFTKKRIIAGVVVLVVVLLGVGGIVLAQTWDKINNNQMDLFNQSAPPTSVVEETPSDAPTTTPSSESASPGQTDGVTTTPVPTPTIDPYDALYSQADLSLMKDTLNVLLIGVDYAAERDNNPKEYVGKYFNSDVMLVLSINFKKNKVDMVSVPRDTYAKIANIDGIYKLNFSLTAGGGINEKGYKNVCNSVSGVLGGVPINYYIAVTMPVVKQLTDAVGGVDYDMDVSFTINGRSYKKGMQHMDGQAVLDYCRVRKGELSAQPGDLNRVNRQKKVLVAVFKKLQTTATILDVPKIITSVKDCDTNMNFSQLAALAVFGKKLPNENITMRTLAGSTHNIFNRNFVLIDQTKRVQLIKDVWGISVPKQYKYAPEFAELQWAYMRGEKWMKEVNTVLIKDAKLAADKKKLVDPVLNEKLATAIKNTQTAMNKYRDKVYHDSKPVASSTEYKDLQTQILALQTAANNAFNKAGYKVSWTVDVYKPGQLRMKE